MNSTKILAFAAACLLPIAAMASSPIDGTWTGSIKARNGGPDLTLTFTFKADGDKVTGSVMGNLAPVPIVSGSIKGSTFNFKVLVNGAEVNHTCTISGSGIDMTYTFSGQPPSRLMLKRVEAAAVVGPDPSGLWIWTIAPQGSGQVFNVTASLSFAEGKLAGSYHSQMGDAPITDASFKNGAIAFNVVREHDGKEFTVKYRGTLVGDSITGTLELPGFDGGDSATVDWKAARAK
ncbi:MAG TPA: hypothetical protein VII43_08050 [Opitutaceae bacterium]